MCVAGTWGGFVGLCVGGEGGADYTLITPGGCDSHLTVSKVNGLQFWTL